MTGHKLNVSIGSGGVSANVAGRRKVDKSDRITLNKTKVPKYTTTNLFLYVIAYTLRRNRFSQLGNKGKRVAYLIVMNISEEAMRKVISTTMARNPAMHLGGRNDVNKKRLPLVYANTDWTSHPNCKEIWPTQVKTLRCGGDISV